MSILKQKTLNEPIVFEGITLHKGKVAKVRILPSPPNSGIVFKRIDLDNNQIIDGCDDAPLIAEKKTDDEQNANTVLEYQITGVILVALVVIGFFTRKKYSG